MPSPSITTTTPGHGGGDAGSAQKNGTATSLMVCTLMRVRDVAPRGSRRTTRSIATQHQGVGDAEAGAGQVAARVEPAARDDRVREIARPPDRRDDRGRHADRASRSARCRTVARAPRSCSSSCARSRRAAARTRISSISSGRHRIASAIAMTHSSTGSRSQRSGRPRRASAGATSPSGVVHPIERAGDDQHDRERGEARPLVEAAEAEADAADVGDRLRRSTRVLSSAADHEHAEEPVRQARERAERDARDEQFEQRRPRPRCRPSATSARSRPSARARPRRAASCPPRAGGRAMCPERGGGTSARCRGAARPAAAGDRGTTGAAHGCASGSASSSGSSRVMRPASSSTMRSTSPREVAVVRDDHERDVARGGAAR